MLWLPFTGQLSEFQVARPEAVAVSVVSGVGDLIVISISPPYGLDPAPTRFPGSYSDT